jgi:predicted nuclease of predicted toxin-antitoxin system
MKFIVDAQLPRRIARFLQDTGYDAIHTLDLPQQNSTPDSSVNNLSIAEERIVITKDSDFVDSFLTIQKPYKLGSIGLSMLVLAVNNLRANKQSESLEAPLSSIVGCILNPVDPQVAPHQHR